MLKGALLQSMNGADFHEKRRAAEEVVSRLVKHGFSALFAGGYVRDKLLGNLRAPISILLPMQRLRR